MSDVFENWRRFVEKTKDTPLPGEEDEMPLTGLTGSGDPQYGVVLKPCVHKTAKSRKGC